MKKIFDRIKKFQDYQWKKPKVYLTHKFGISFWKWCGMIIPEIRIHLGEANLMGFVVFDHGYGFTLDFPKIIIVNYCIKGKIGGRYKHKIFRLRILNKELSF